MAAAAASDEERFEEWMKKYNKQYKDEDEKARRFRSFKINLRIVDAHLADKNLKFHALGLNQHADMVVDEFLTEVLGRNLNAPSGWTDSDSDSDEGEGEGKREGDAEGAGNIEFQRQVEGKGEDEFVQQRPLVPGKRPRIGCDDQRRCYSAYQRS